MYRKASNKKKGRPNFKNKNDKTLSYVLDIIKEGVWDWNVNTGVVKRSPGWFRMLDYDIDIFEKTVFTWENIIHPDDYPSVMKHFEDYINGKSDIYDIEYRCRKFNNEYLWIRDQGKIVERNADGSAARMIGAHLNIHEQKLAQLVLQRQNKLLSEDKFTLENIIKERTMELEEANRKLKQNIERINILSNTDFLTTISNRQKAEAELNKEMARSRRYKTPLCVALFDIDRFKTINDLFGHQIGDTVLKKISEVVLKNIRKTDIFSRWGGDEFFIILPGIDSQNALNGIDKIRVLISEHEFFESLHVTCSFGVAQYIFDETVDSLFKRADQALYTSKSAGRNAVNSF